MNSPIKPFLIFLLTLFLASPADVYSQRIEGVVYDSYNQIPVSNANVYLEGATLFTITDSLGRFELKAAEKINTRLVISHISYETAFISDPFTHVADTVFLEERSLFLGEVIIGKEKFSRDLMLKVFYKQFLGTSRSARSCEIINEDDLILYYEAEERLLSAVCYKPLRIENKYLGYILHLDLNHFNIRFRGKNIRGDDVSSVDFEGGFFFEDIRPENETIKKRRYQVFDGSSMHFLRTITKNKWKKSDQVIYRDAEYMLYKEGERLGRYAENCFTLSDTLSYKKVKLDYSIQQRNGTYEGRPYVAKLYVQRNQKNSELIFFSEQIIVDQSGLLVDPENVLFRGYMGTQRIGDQLPIDYGL